MRKNTKRSAVIAGVAAVAIGGGVAAWAANGWTIDGSGTAEADASKIIPLEATAVFDKALFPGITSTITMTVKNQNDFPVNVTGPLEPTDVTVTVPPKADAKTVGDPVKCKAGLGSKGTALIEKATVPPSNKISAKSSNEQISSNVTIGSLPQDCAGLHIVATYSFKSVSTV